LLDQTGNVLSKATVWFEEETTVEGGGDFLCLARVNDIVETQTEGYQIKDWQGGARPEYEKANGAEKKGYRSLEPGNGNKLSRQELIQEKVTGIGGGGGQVRRGKIKG